MVWGHAEATDEILRWRAQLAVSDRARVDFHVARLEAEGVFLGEPHTKQLAGKLRELRFALSFGDFRITYFIAREGELFCSPCFARPKLGNLRRSSEHKGRCGRGFFVIREREHGQA